MNTKHSFWNRLFAALLLAVMLVTQTTTAFAVEDSPEPTEPSMVQAQDSDTGTEEAGEGTDTPEGGSLSEGPETALQTVSSLEELLQAIEQAEAGATIGIGCEIVCPDGTVLGDTYKRVTLQRTAPEGHKTRPCECHLGGLRFADSCVILSVVLPINGKRLVPLFRQGALLGPLILRKGG